MPDLTHEIQRRRTFAIISHPDAGKTTLTEKLLLYGGAIREAGSVKARRGGQSATSDWMDIEKKRGISISSSALQFEYDGFCVNLLDTPGHQDFSEDTYRTLVAADAALMLIDGAKGVEPQTIKLFKVCRDRGIPIVTVVNKMDRPARAPLDLMDEVEKTLGITITPASWPIGSGDSFRGVYSLRDKEVLLFEKTAHNATQAAVQTTGPDDPQLREALGERAHDQLVEDLMMVEECVQPFELDAFLKQEISPMFFCSALVNFGVETILKHFIDMAPQPGPLPTLDGDQLNEVHLDGVEVPVDRRVGPEHGAWRLMAEALADERHVQFPPARVRRAVGAEEEARVAAATFAPAPRTNSTESAVVTCSSTTRSFGKSLHTLPRCRSRNSRSRSNTSTRASVTSPCSSSGRSTRSISASVSRTRPQSVTPFSELVVAPAG